MIIHSLRVLLVSFAVSSSVFAQQDFELEEIVVTAQRREQNQQEVPVSITAFSGGTLERANITKASEYLALTPNVGFSDGQETGTRGVSISIRGVNDLKSGQNSVISSIGVYLDEFSVVASANRGAVNPNLQDLERVEVLRGPQGTYFGRNSVGGALNLTTKSPTDKFEGEIRMGGEAYDTRGSMGQGTVILNMPVSENLAVRGVGHYENNSGMVKNIASTGVDSGYENIMGRITALYTPTEATTVKLMVMHSDENQDGDESVPSGVWGVDTTDGYVLGVAGGVSDLTEVVDTEGIGFYPNNRDTNSRDKQEFNDSKTTIAILNISHELSDTFTLKSITGVFDSEFSRRTDEDQLGDWDNFFTEASGDSLSFSTELRGEYNGDAFELVGGVLYARDEQEITFDVIGGSAFTAPVGPTGPNDPNGVVLLSHIAAFIPPGLCFLCERKPFVADEIAVFADFTWHATDQLDLIVGARYTHDKIESTLITNGPLVTDDTVTGIATGSQKFDDFSPRFVARYQATDEFSLYGSVSKGYKAGGTSLGFNDDTVNVPLPAIIETPFKEETVWSYEIGFKSEWLDNRLRINAAAFYIDWSDLQLEAFRFLVPGNLQSKFALTTNLDEAEAKGFEVEFVAAISERFTFSGGLGYLDSEITKSGPQELSGGFIVDLDGLDIPRAPKLTVNLVGEYRWQMGNGDAWARLEYIHRGSQKSDLEAIAWKQIRGQILPNSSPADPALLTATPNGFPFVTPEYDLINLRAGYEWDKFFVDVYIDNAFDEKYYTSSSENFGIGGIRIRPHPRTFGGSVGYRFGGI